MRLVLILFNKQKAESIKKFRTSRMFHESDFRSPDIWSAWNIFPETFFPYLGALKWFGFMTHDYDSCSCEDSTVNQHARYHFISWNGKISQKGSNKNDVIDDVIMISRWRHNDVMMTSFLLLPKCFWLELCERSTLLQIKELLRYHYVIEVLRNILHLLEMCEVKEVIFSTPITRALRTKPCVN